MRRKSDPYKAYMRDLELKMQEIEDGEDLDLVNRLQTSCYRVSTEAIREFIRAFRNIGIKRGMSTAEARTWADKQITSVLDVGRFNPDLSVKKVS